MELSSRYKVPLFGLDLIGPIKMFGSSSLFDLIFDLVFGIDVLGRFPKFDLSAHDWISLSLKDFVLLQEEFIEKLDFGTSFFSFGFFETFSFPLFFNLLI